MGIYGMNNFINLRSTVEKMVRISQKEKTVIILEVISVPFSERKAVLSINKWQFPHLFSLPHELFMFPQPWLDII